MTARLLEEFERAEDGGAHLCGEIGQQGHHQVDGRRARTMTAECADDHAPDPLVRILGRVSKQGEPGVCGYLAELPDRCPA
jgi:hypothetical protein